MAGASHGPKYCGAEGGWGGLDGVGGGVNEGKLETRRHFFGCVGKISFSFFFKTFFFIPRLSGGGVGGCLLMLSRV